MQKLFFEGPSLHQALGRWIFGFLVFVALNACAAGPQLVRHTFAFDVLADSPDAEVLDYRYGESRFPAASNPAELREQGKALQGISIYGAMRKADSLYVKWRVKSTDQVHEDTVDLGRRLPGDFTDHRVYFIVNGPQLYVYLITPERRPPDMPPNGPRTYHHLKTITLYPENSKP